MRQTEELNPAEDQGWTQIGAENGFTARQYNLYRALIESESVFDRSRALFWRSEAAAVDADARKELALVEHEKLAQHH